VTTLAGELTAAIFAGQELAFSSMKGGKSNAHKGQFQRSPWSHLEYKALFVSRTSFKM
jgi:hypothetical protein